MKNITFNVFGLIALPLLIACSTHNMKNTTNPTPTPTPTQEESTEENHCSIYDSRNWHAWLDTFDLAKGKYRLNITGEVDLPSPGYELTWKMGIADRAFPPGQNITLSAKKPDGRMSIQVITPTAVSLKQEVPHAAYRKIAIFCGDTLLTTITDVQLTD